MQIGLTRSSPTRELKFKLLNNRVIIQRRVGEIIHLELLRNARSVPLSPFVEAGLTANWLERNNLFIKMQQNKLRQTNKTI